MSDDVRLTMRLPRDLHDELMRDAAQEDRSLHGQILSVLRRGKAAHIHALKLCVAYIDSIDGSENSVVQAAEAAIAKSTGERS